ncbi:MAG: LLM class F420-dependent oxidoreductase [Actinobacteria bacterium]|nr:LLM class F420-dependent oxidoreductase [Actinomycetota bacterium]
MTEEVPVEFVFQYPDLHGLDGDMLDAGDVSDLATRAERYGWHGFAFTEHPAPTAKWLEAGGHQSLDPFVALSHVAAVTSRLRLITYISVLPYRNPMITAKAAATVDKLSNGRFVLGVGTGYLKAEYFAVGVDFDERNEIFDEALAVMPMHWSGEPFSFAGKHFDCRGIIGRPRPVQQPIPIWIGGNSNLTLRRIASSGQGWMPLVSDAAIAPTVRSPILSTPEDVAERLKVLRDLAGDRFDSLDIMIPYADHSIHDLGRDVERHRDLIGRISAIGTTQLAIAGPSAPHPAAAEFIEGFAATYMNP